MFTRALFAGVNIDTPCEVVWRCLTGYDDLGTFIPSLAVNRCLQVCASSWRKRPTRGVEAHCGPDGHPLGATGRVRRVAQKFSNGCRLEQVGEQDVALGAKFKARVVLSIHEYEGGVPKSQLAEDKEPFPLPRSPIPGQCARRGGSTSSDLDLGVCAPSAGRPTGRACPIRMLIPFLAAQRASAGRGTSRSSRWRGTSSASRACGACSRGRRQTRRACRTRCSSLRR